MRFIDVADVSPSDDWLAKAAAITASLLAAADSEARATIIVENAAVWSELKNWLMELSSGKCWYSEVRESYSTYDVDHYRPKLRARQMDGAIRTGYWWLAFDWRNFRVSGVVGNRRLRDAEGQIGGKGDYFPLRDGAAAAQGPDEDISLEMPLLLDPTDPNDPNFLSFNEDGVVVPTTDSGVWGAARVETTIELLHLNWQPLVDARLTTWQHCRRSLERIRWLLANREAGTPDFRDQITDEMRELRGLARATAPLSSVTRDCLLKSGIPWAQRLAAQD